MQPFTAVVYLRSQQEDGNHTAVSQNVMENNRPLENITDFIEHCEYWQSERPKDTWHVDWRLSYTLHGWNHAVEGLVEYQMEGDD